MTIYVLRHGIATDGLAPGVKSDQARPLTAKGRKKMNKIAAAMQKMGLELDLILSSPCVRARQTAEIVAEAFHAQKRLEFMQELSTGATPGALFQRLARQHLLPEGVLLVGHEPQLSGFVSLLMTGTEGAQVQLKKGGLCKLSVSRLRAKGRATLEWLLTPKQMTGLA